jgi:uncharacterized oligopeptide transporter (OPT) family protein
MAVLRVLGRQHDPRKQHRADRRSAGSSIASGVIFTIPALVLLGHWSDFRYAWVLAIAGLGGILGVFFSVTAAPLADRRAEPQFPEGVRRPKCSRPATTRRRA